MEKIIERIYAHFEKKERDNSRITIRVKTINPIERISYQQWCNEFNVSMLHNRVIVHMN